MLTENSSPRGFAARGGQWSLGAGGRGSANDIVSALDGTTFQATRVAQGIKSGEIGVQVLGRWGHFKEAWKAGGLGYAFGTRAFAVRSQVFLRQSRFGDGGVFGDAVHEGVHALDFLSERGLAGRSRWGLEARAWSAELEFLRTTGGPVTADTLQLVDDLKIPGGKWNTSPIPEPITRTFPNFGPGGGRQAITTTPIRDFELFPVPDP